MENLLEIIVVGLVLSVDSFSAALAMGARNHKFSDSLKFAFSSGGAEALVSFLGAIAGVQIISRFDSIDHWVSFFLLIIVAIHMFYEGVCEFRDRDSQKENEPKKFHSFFKILLVSFATSLDAFAVGVSLGVAGKPLLAYISSIGLWAFFSTIIGMSIAKKVSNKIGPLFNFIAAFVLIALAVKFLSDGL